MIARRGSYFNHDKTDRVAYAVILVAVLLSCTQFFVNRSLWLDEANLARNIISSSFFDLLRPLDHGQVAPILYLQLTKAFSLLTPNLEYGLRVLPLIAFWGSLYLFYLTVRILIREKPAMILALALFAFNPTILYFSGEVKQYMTDVFVAVLFLYLSVKNYEKPNSRFLWLAIAGMMAVWLSNIAPLLLIGVGAHLLFQARKGDAAWIGKTVAVGVSWLISFAIYYMLFIQDHPTREYMVTYWRNEGAFLPANPFSKEFFIFLKEKSGLVGPRNFSKKFVVIVVFLGVATAGIVFLLKKRRYPLISLLVLPVLAHMILSSQELYPFGRRLVLYMVPLLIVLGGCGVNWLLEAIKKTRIYPYLHRGMYILPLLIAIPLWGSFPRERQEIKESLQFIVQHGVDGQRLFLSPGSSAAYTYYSQTGFFDAAVFSGVTKAEWPWNQERIFSELMAGDEGPCWVLLSNDSHGFEKYLLEQLQVVGIFPLKSFQTEGSGAYLLDL